MADPTDAWQTRAGLDRPVPPVGNREDLIDLGVSLQALSGLAMGRMGLEETLVAVATFAVQAVPGADGAGLLLRESGRADVVVATSERVTEVERIQHDLSQGPAISAVQQRQPTYSGSLGSEEQWRQFGSRAARKGMHSAVAVPLQTDEGVVGALTVYAQAKHAFDERARRLGRLFATPAAVAVQNAQVLARCNRSIAQLQRALDERAEVERAVGIMIARSGSSPHEALDRLRQLSQEGHQKLAAISARMVEEATRIARARRSR